MEITPENPVPLIPVNLIHVDDAPLVMEITPELLARFARPHNPVPLIHVDAPARRQRKSHAVKVERCGVKQAAAILGLSKRKVQDMAARAEIPGVAKIARVWTFDIERLRRHLRLKERQAWQNGKHRPDATGEAMPFGAGPRAMAEKSDGRFTRVTQRLRGRGARRGSTG